MTFQEILKHLRSKGGFTYGKLSKLSGVTKAQLFDLEAGNQKNPTLKTMLAIAKAYDLTIIGLLKYLDVSKADDE